MRSARMKIVLRSGGGADEEDDGRAGAAGDADGNDGGFASAGGTSCGADFSPGSGNAASTSGATAPNCAQGRAWREQCKERERNGGESVDHPRGRVRRMGVWHMPMVKSRILVHRVGKSPGSLAAGRIPAGASDAHVGFHSSLPLVPFRKVSDR